MSGVNKVILLGNLGRDPEIKYTPDGTPVANVSIATSETWKDKNTGEKKEKTEWHRLVFWRNLAEIVERFLRKGSKIYVEGKQKTRSWEKDGITRYITEVHCNEMTMLDPPTEGRKSPDQGSSYPGASYEPPPEDDDIPF